MGRTWKKPAPILVEPVAGVRDGFETAEGAQVLCEIANRLMNLYVEEEDYESAAMLRDAHEEIGSIALGYNDWTKTSEGTAYSLLCASRWLRGQLEVRLQVYIFEGGDGLYAQFIAGDLDFRFPVTPQEADWLQG